MGEPLVRPTRLGRAHRFLIHVVGTFRRPEEFEHAPNDRWLLLAGAILAFPLFFVYYGGQVLDALCCAEPALAVQVFVAHPCAGVWPC